MDKLFKLLTTLWVIILLGLGFIGAGVAYRQFQIWRARDTGHSLAAGILALIMAGISAHGFLWIVALTMFGDVKPPKSFTVTMMVAETALSVPIWLWLGMLLGLIHDGPLLVGKKLSGDRTVDEWEASIRRIVREEIDRPFKEEE